MATPNFQNRTLFKGENLDFLRGMNSQTVDLIATDPPFNKGKDFHATPESLAAGARFQDRWRWQEDVQPDWVDAIKDDHPRVYSLINHVVGGIDNAPKTRKRLGGREDLAAFLCFMGIRLIEMRRILKDTGSLYLHCDPTASHYLKALMDAIFGDKCFRNEIMWLRKQGEKHNLARKRMPSAHDVILYYVKSAAAQYSPQYTPYSDDYIKKNYKHKDERGVYSTFPCTNDAGGNRPYEFRGITRAWRFKPETMQEMYDAGLLVQARPTSPFRYKKYLDKDAGVKVDDCWLDVPQVRSKPENTGYPTQKPLALYERIIKASSNEGDIVLDPFCGCATTPIAAERLGRRWVGMDLWDGAYDIVRQRMEDNRQLLANPNAPILYTEDAPVRADDDDAAAGYLPPIYRRNRQSSIPRDEMMRILVDKWGLVCWGCGFEPPTIDFLELDHNTPASSGGSNELHNRAPLCGPCNRRKSNTKTLEGLRRENKRAGRWYGAPIDKRLPPRLVFGWAQDYLANLPKQADLSVSA